VTLREKAATIAPSAWLKDTLIGGVGILAIRISYVYLKSFSTHPELLARMGPGVINGILAISIAGVLVNRLVEALGTGIGRMADSAERTAQCTADGTAAQQQLAVSQAQIAAAFQQFASRDDRQAEQLQVLVGTVVVQNKQILRHIHGQDRALERLEDKAGINRPRDEAREEDDGQ
jgi:hypothetical protein